MACCSLGIAAHLIVPKQPLRISRFNQTIFKNPNKFTFASQQISSRWNQENFLYQLHVKCSYAKTNKELRFDDEFHQEPFWLTLLKEGLWGFRSLLFFLIEQPSQLRYIEWPTFQSTLKTATLTLVLVALLIVALSSIDSGLCYLLTVLVRRKA